MKFLLYSIAGSYRILLPKASQLRCNRLRHAMYSTRTYREAVDNLNTLQSNAAALDAVRASGKLNNDATFLEMYEYVKRIGYTPEDLNQLNVVHVTGTKGKGSTCAFITSLLRHAKPSWKIGLYTSPHLVAVRERIRINGEPISEEQFSTFFFDVWDRLEQNPERANPATPLRPMYFRFLTLVAFHAYISLKVDATVLEVGVGGLYDCTNVVPRPLVTGVASLGIDHTIVLGNTIASIAWNKGGIFKEGVPAFTVPQPEEGMEQLKKQAIDRKAASLTIAPPMTELEDVKLGLSGLHQLQNASLALQMSSAYMAARGEPNAILPLNSISRAGLEDAKWPGRCQEVRDPADSTIRWFLDGAHTVESLKACMEWYVSTDVGLRSSRPLRVLIFNCTSGRSAQTLLNTLLTTAANQLQIAPSASLDPSHSDGLFDEVIFCTNVTYADGGFKGDLTSRALDTTDLSQLKTQHELADAWKSLVPDFPANNVHVLPSIEHAVKFSRSVEMDRHGKDILVAGSLHLVGGVIEVAGLADVALRT